MTIGIDPIIGSIGPFVFHWYGVIMAVAVVVGLWIFSRQLTKRKISSHHALGIAIIAVPCGIIGARLFSVADNFGYFWHNPGKIFGLGLVGLAIYGVIAGGIFGVIVYSLWKKLPLLRVLDSTALAFPVAQIIGRCANIINGDTWGPPTKLPWGFTYTNPHAFLPANLLGVPTHPTPVYEQIWLIIVIVALLLLIPRMKADGMAFFAYVGLYSLGRFFISYYRENNILLLGLREAQLFAVAGIVLTPIAIYILWRRQRGKPHAANGKKPAARAKARGRRR
jgi:phosphatidylglycerol---prolipoprotein diacylglyceryl transferase